MIARLGLLACVATLAAAPVLARSEEPPPRALIVTGVDHPAHDWKQTTPVVRRLLEDAAFRVDVVEDEVVVASVVVVAATVAEPGAITAHASASRAKTC